MARSSRRSPFPIYVLKNPPDRFAADLATSAEIEDKIRVFHRSLTEGGRGDTGLFQKGFDLGKKFFGLHVGNIIGKILDAQGKDTIRQDEAVPYSPPPMKAKETKPEMSRARENLMRAISDAGLSLRDVSLKIPRNETYLHQFVNKGSPRVLPELVRKRLSVILEIDEGLLKEEDYTTLGRPTGGPLRRGPEAQYPTRDLPIMGRARAATDDALVLEGGYVGMTERPSYLVGVADAFAVYVHGDSMDPRFKSGELAYVNPHKPPIAGDDILVEFEDGTGLVKELIRFTQATLVVKQYNPRKEIVFDLKRVRRVSTIEGRRRR